MRSIVVGAGVTGLSAARRLAQAGDDVTVLEAGTRTGGAVHTVAFAGRRVEAGAESLFVHDPDLLRTLDALGLGDEVVRARRRFTWIVTPRGRRALPEGVGPAGPTRLLPLIRSRVIGPGGLARAALEPLLPATPLDGDPSIGEVMRARLGPAVTEALVEPLAGGLHAGDIDRLSLEAVLPSVAASLRTHGSLLRAAAARRRREGRQRPAASPFLTLRPGMDRLTDALATGLDVRLGHRVTGLRRDGAWWQVLVDGDALTADRVVLAVAAEPARRLLREALPQADLPTSPAASVAVVLLAYPSALRSHPALAATGLLVPRGHPSLLKAATFLSSKWAHLDDGPVLVRASAGRAGSPPPPDDDRLVARVVDDLARLTGLPTAPDDVRVVHWPDSMPQYTVGHRRGREIVAAALDRLPGVAVAGAAFDGVGVPACLRAGAAAGDRLLVHPSPETAR